MLLLISTSSFFKFHTRRFHVSSKIFLRKITSKNSSSSAGNVSLSSTNIPSNDLISGADYLGIESDEGIITINPQKHSHLQQNPIPLKIKEKFHRSTFGVVRYDKDNSLKHHGQYGRKFNFTFPHSSSDDAQVFNNLKKKTNDHDFDDHSLKQSEELEKKNHINYIDDNYFEHSRMDNLTQNETIQVLEELNFKDEISVGSLHSPENMFVQQESSTNSLLEIAINNEQSRSKELNFIEKDYFEILGSNADPSVKKASITKNIAEMECSLNHPVSEEINYIEKSYFETSSNLKHSSSGEESLENHLTEKEQCIFSINNNIDASTTNELSSCKKSYLGDCTFSDNYASINEQSAENIIVNKESAAYNSADISKKHETEQLGTEIQSNDIPYTESRFLNQTKLNTKIYENEIKDNAKSDFEYNGNQTVYNNNNKAYEDNFKKLRSSTEILQRNATPHEYTKSCGNTHSSSKMNIETENSFSKKNNLKYSKLHPEEHDQNEQITTAHDFVKKLRQEQNQTTNKGEALDNQKVDSKGFRILSSQIKDLSHCTHDEILNILKQNIVYSDENLLVLNKPYNMVIHESRTTKIPCLSMFLNDLAKEMGGESSPQLFTVHRLDKETTGCLLLARNERMAMNLKSLFAQRKITKKYWIVTSGVPDPREGVIDIPISEGTIENRKRMVLHPKLPDDIIYRSHSKNGKPAVTSYKVLSDSGNASLVEATPVTGIKHQIRVHFGFGLGCPILGDHKYSHLDKLAPQKLPSDMLQRLHVRQSKVRHIPMHIHAKSVLIPDYFEERDLFVHIPLPDHMKDNLKRLKFRKKDMVR